MLDFLLPEKHAISVLKNDHDTVKDLFEKFEKAESSSEKERIIEGGPHCQDHFPAAIS
jgi:alpha/beta superfamily hydrolase